MDAIPEIDLVTACRSSMADHGETPAWSGRPDLPAFLRRERVIANRSGARASLDRARAMMMVSLAAVVAPPVAQVTFGTGLPHAPLAFAVLIGIACSVLAHRAAGRAELRVLRLWGREHMLENVAYAVSDRALYVAEIHGLSDAVVTRYDASTILKVEMSVRDGGSQDLDLWIAHGRLRLKALPDAQAALDCLTPLANGITKTIVRG